MTKIMEANELTHAFARFYNTRDLDGLMSLYEDGAVMRYGSGKRTLTGKAEIRAFFARAMENPARIVQDNKFCFEQDGLALARADYTVVADDGSVVNSGSSCEVLRRQHDGSWLYFIDHGSGAGLPRIEGL
jgi:uncharacterized protein (TIGR02246 family)